MKVGLDPVPCTGLDAFDDTVRKAVDAADTDLPLLGVQDPAESRYLVLLVDSVTDSGGNSPPVVRVSDDGDGTVDQSFGVEQGSL